MQPEKPLQDTPDKEEALQDITPAFKLLFFTFFLLFTIISLFILLHNNDYDLFWRIKQGELVVTEGRLPVKDCFSYTRNGVPTIAHGWLSEVFFYLLYKAAGFEGIAVFMTLILTSMFGILFAVFRKMGTSPGSGLILTLVCSSNFLIYTANRTQNFTFLLFSIVLYLLACWDQGDDSALWKIAALTPLWVNLHSGFILAPLILLLTAIIRIRESKQFNFSFFAPFAVSILAAGLHPNGFFSLSYPLKQMFSNPAAKELVFELRTLDIAEAFAFYPYLLVLIGIVFLGLSWRSTRFWWGLLCLGFLWQSLHVMRMAPFFAMTGTAVIAAKIKDEDWENSRLFKNVRFFVAAVTLLLILSHFNDTQRHKISEWREKGWDSGYPSQSARVVKERYPNRNIFTTYNWGGYLLFNLYPNNRVSLDSRGADLYMGYFDRDYQVIRKGGRRAVWLLDHSKADMAIIEAGSILYHDLRRHPGWEMVVSTPLEGLFVKKTGDTDSGLKMQEGPHTSGIRWVPSPSKTRKIAD